MKPVASRSTIFNRILALALVVSTSALAQSLADAPIILHSGQWDVHRTQNPMTDSNVCTAVYKNRDDIQLTKNMLTIAIADGVNRVRLRFDDEDPHAWRPATAREIKNGRIEIDAQDFSALLDSKRLRYEAVTASHSTVSGDIDLDGAFLAHGNVEAGCAGNPIAVPAKVVTNACTPQIRIRMTKKGLSAQDIADICAD